MPVPPDPKAQADAYAAADAVLYPSHWEGFGLPPVEAALHGRPVVVGNYPIAAELVDLGFRWLRADDPAPLAAVLDDPATAGADLAHNRAIAIEHLGHAGMRARLAAVLAELGR